MRATAGTIYARPAQSYRLMMSGWEGWSAQGRTEIRGPIWQNRAGQREAQGKNECQRDGKQQYIRAAEARHRKCSEGARAVRAGFAALMLVTLARNGNFDRIMAGNAGTELDGQLRRRSTDHIALRHQYLHAQSCRQQQDGQRAMIAYQGAESRHSIAPIVARSPVVISNVPLQGDELQGHLEWRRIYAICMQRAQTSFHERRASCRT